MRRLLRGRRFSVYATVRPRLGFYRHRRQSGYIDVRRPTGLPPEVEEFLGVGVERLPGPERLIYTAFRLGWLEFQWRARER